MPILRDAQAITLAGIRVTDYRGTIVASTGEALGSSLAHTEEVSHALRGKAISLLRKRVLEQTDAVTGLDQPRHRDPGVCRYAHRPR